MSGIQTGRWLDFAAQRRREGALNKSPEQEWAFHRGVHRCVWRRVFLCNGRKTSPELTPIQCPLVQPCLCVKYCSALTMVVVWLWLWGLTRQLSPHRICHSSPHPSQQKASETCIPVLITQCPFFPDRWVFSVSPWCQSCEYRFRAWRKRS